MGGVIKSVTGAFFGGAEKDAARAEEAGQRAGAAQFRAGGEEIQELFQPQVEFGGTALEQLAGLSGARGVEEEARAIQQFQASPTFALGRREAEQSLLRNQAAIGGLGGGNIRKALQAQAIDRLTQGLNQRFGRLGAISNVGQSGLTQQAQGIQFGAGGAAQGLIGAGQARGQGITNQAAGIRTGIGQLAGGVAGGIAGGAPGGGGILGGVLSGLF